MKKTLLILLALGFVSLFSVPVFAQTDNEAAVYRVADVEADVTAESATKARDQALAKAQRMAFEQLLARLGADSSLAAQNDDEAIASFVRAFEVQQERRSAVRYIGTFTIEFKPQTVRDYLGSQGLDYSEVRSRPVLVLPIQKTADRTVLWEEETSWRAAWRSIPTHAGLVPIILPEGDLDDIALITGGEALEGKAPSFLPLLNKYQAGSLAVAVLNIPGDGTLPIQDLKIDLQRFDLNGGASEVSHLSLPAAQDTKTFQTALAQGVKQIRQELEAAWRKGESHTGTPMVQSGPALHLPVTAPLASLADWATLKQKLATVPMISKFIMLSLTRGEAQIELVFYGDIPALQEALAQKQIQLEQGSRGWNLILRPFEP